MIRYILGSTFIFIAPIYIWKKLYNKRINFKNYKLYLITLLMIIAILINYYYNIVFIRILCITVLLAFTNKVFFNEDLKSTIMSTVLAELILTLSDCIYAVVVLYMLRIDLATLPYYFGTLIPNIFALIVSIMIANLKITTRLYNFLLKIVDSVKQRKVVLFSLLIIISLNLLLALIYFKLNTYYLFFINATLILIYSLVVIRSFETSNKNEIINAQNESLMESLNEYENMVDRQRVDNHENKNQLLIIKNMIKKNDSDVLKYIDTVVKDEKEDDEILYTRVKNIPTGGLQGIIYQKMLAMKDNRILFSLSVSRDVRNINLENLSMSDNYKLCKIVGVLLDNAIEASLICDDKRIMISLYVDEDMLIIEISNRYSEKIDLENIDKEGYTTKGDGHGYGLSLVKEIVSDSKIFTNERKVTKDIFKQTIKIDLKNI